MKDNNKHPRDFKYFDTSKTYLCPMIRETTEYPNEVEDIVEVRLQEERYGYFINAIKPGYQSKYFYDKYLSWLFYTNYIKEV